MAWVNNDLQNRQDYLAQLIEHVRLPLLSQEYLVQRVEEEPLLKSNHLCKDFLIEAMKYHLLKGEQKVMYKTPRTKPRTPIGRPKVCILYILFFSFSSLQTNKNYFCVFLISI